MVSITNGLVLIADSRVDRNVVTKESIEPEGCACHIVLHENININYSHG